jgi:hypothetical protein
LNARFNVLLIPYRDALVTIGALTYPLSDHPELNLIIPFHEQMNQQLTVSIRVNREKQLSQLRHKLDRLKPLLNNRGFIQQLNINLITEIISDKMNNKPLFKE